MLITYHRVTLQPATRRRRDGAGTAAAAGAAFPVVAFEKTIGVQSRQVHDMFDMLGRRRLFVPTAGCRACWVPTDMAQEYGNKTYTVLAFGAFRSHTTTAISLNAFNTSMNR